MAANGISTLEFKRDRVIAKLDLAEAKRIAADAPLKYYDLDLLPTLPGVNSNAAEDIVDNINEGGLQLGRPWVTEDPTPDAPLVVTESLVVHLDAGDTDSYPGTGTTWTNLVDDTAYTISNGTFDSGSIVFNGTNTYVEIGTPLSSGANFTKEAWVNADVVSGTGRNIISSESNVFWINAGTLSGGVANSFAIVTSTSFPTTVWRHVVMTHDDTNNTMTLYINGVQVDQETSSLNYTSQVERIGSHFFGGNPVSFFDGKIAQVRVYNAALSATDVLANYDNTKATFE